MMNTMFSSEPTPEFNSSIQYLRRVSDLIWSVHIARMETESGVDDFHLLESLDVELDPRMNTNEREMSELLRIRCKGGKSKRYLREWFVFLNRLAHEKKLIMKDADNLPGVIRG